LVEYQESVEDCPALTDAGLADKDEVGDGGGGGGGAATITVAAAVADPPFPEQVIE
jgi:hypothetical protein